MGGYVFANRLSLARLMGQYCFAGWCRSSPAVCRRRLSSSVELPAGRAAAGRVGGRLPTLHGGPVRYVPLID